MAHPGPQLGGAEAGPSPVEDGEQRDGAPVERIGRSSFGQQHSFTAPQLSGPTARVFNHFQQVGYPSPQRFSPKFKLSDAPTIRSGSFASVVRFQDMAELPVGEGSVLRVRRGPSLTQR